MSFASDLASFRRKTGLKMDLVCRKVVFELNRDIILATPVDTGHARANWQIGISVAPTGEIQGTDKSGGSTIAAALPTVQQFGAGKVAYLANNAPYITQLEYGSSKQAPAGMARIAVAKWQAVVDKAVRSVQ